MARIRPVARHHAPAVTTRWFDVAVADTPDRLLVRLAARQHAVFTRRQALECGFTPKMIQGRLDLGLWRPWHRGVYGLTGAPVIWISRLMAACLATGGYASHRSAAALFGLWPQGAIEVIVPRGVRRSRSGVVVREAGDLRRGDLSTLDGVPITTVPRLLVDLAAVLDPSRYEEVLDRAMTRRLVTPDRLRRRAVGVAHGVHGASVLHTALEARGNRPETRLERIVLEILHRGGFDNFEPQVWVTANGERFRLDLADTARRIAVEVDENHHAELSQWKRDVRRQTLLVAMGWTFLRFTEDDARSPQVIWDRAAAVLARIDNPPGRQSSAEA